MSNRINVFHEDGDNNSNDSFEPTISLIHMLHDSFCGFGVKINIRRFEIEMESVIE